MSLALEKPVLPRQRVKKPKKVTVLGCGQFGTAIAKIVGQNAVRLPQFNNLVLMYVREEKIDGKKLSKIINETHENVKYLPGVELPKNVVAIPNVEFCAREADILFIIVPKMYLSELCRRLIRKVKPTAIAVSLIKSFDYDKSEGVMDLASQFISRYLRIPCAVMIGANLADEMAKENFTEITIGCRNSKAVPYLRAIIETSYMRVTVVDDKDTMEICGSLNNVAKFAIGFIGGMNMTLPTKVLTARLAILEAFKFLDYFFPGGKLCTTFESCGYSDIIADMFGGHTQIAERFVKMPEETLVECAKALFPHKRLEGQLLVHQLNLMLKDKEVEDEFPIFTGIAKMCTREIDAQEFFEIVQTYPKGAYVSKRITFQ